MPPDQESLLYPLDTGEDLKRPPHFGRGAGALSIDHLLWRRFDR